MRSSVKHWRGGVGFVLMTASVKGRDVGFVSHAQARVFGMTMFGDDIGQ